MAPAGANDLAAGYAGLTDDEEEVSTPAQGAVPVTPSRSGVFTADAAQQSLDDLAALFQNAFTELRNPHLTNPVEVARKLRERVKSVTEVNIHRDKKKAAEFETIDYMPQDSEMYRKWLHTQPLQRLWDRWLMMFLVGIVVGLCAFSLHVCFHTLATWKVCTRCVRRLAPGPGSGQVQPQEPPCSQRNPWVEGSACLPGPPARGSRVRLVCAQTNVLRYIISKNVGLAWLFNVSYSLALVAISAGSVLWISPAAAGSGVPEVMAYLNGCHIPKARVPRSCRLRSRCHVVSTRARIHARCSSGRRPPSSSCHAPHAWVLDYRLDRRCAPRGFFRWPALATPHRPETPDTSSFPTRRDP